MATRHELIHIDFVANAGKANPVLQSLKDSCESARVAKERLDDELTNAKTKGAPKQVIDEINNKLIEQTKIYTALQRGVREYAKGIDTLSKGIKEFNEGTLDQMSPKFNKALENSAKLAQSNFKSNTKEWSDLQTVIEAAHRNVLRAREDIDGLMQSMKDGASVSANQLGTARDVLKDLAELAVVGSEDWRGLQKQMNEVAQAAVTVAETERRLKGEIVDEQDALRLSNSLSKESIAQRHAMGEAFVQAAQKERSGIEESMKGLSGKMAQERQEREELKETIELQENYDKLIEKRNKKISDAGQRKQEAEKRIAQAQADIKAYDDQEKKIKDLKQQKKDLEDQLKRETSEAEKAAKSTKTQSEAYDDQQKKVERLDGEIKTLGGDLDKVNDDIEKMTAAQKKSAESSEKQAAAKEKEVKAAKEGAAAKKEEVRTEEVAVKTVEVEKETIESLIAANDKLKIKIQELNEERKKLAEAQKQEAAATKEEINAFKDLTKEQAQAMLDSKKATITKDGDGKFAYTNAEDAQNFLIESIRSVNPKGVSGGAMSLDSAGVAKVRAMFQERFGLESDDDTLAAIRGLLSGGNGSLIKSGMMNNAFSRIDIDVSKVGAYSKEIKDLTAVVNGEVDALKEDSKAVEENTEKKRTLEQVEKEIEAAEKESIQLTLRTRRLRDGQGAAIDAEVQKTDNLTESKKRNVEAMKAEIAAIKEMTAEQAKAAKDAMLEKSTVGYKANKLDMSNPEEVQSFLISQMSKKAAMGRNGSLTISGGQIDSLLKNFKERYGLTSDNKNVKSILKEIAGGAGGGLLQAGGGGFQRTRLEGETIDTFSIKVDKEALDERKEKLNALIAVTNAASKAAAGVTETTKKGTEAAKEAAKATDGETDAIKRQMAEVERRKAAYDKSNDDYEAKKAELQKKKSALSRLPKSGADALLERDKLQGEIDEYKENTVDPARKEAARLKKLWQQSVEQYMKMQGIESEATEKTKKRTKATKDQTIATEESAKAEMTMEELLAKKAEIEGKLTAKKRKLQEEQQKLNELQQQSIAGDKAEKTSTEELLKAKEEEYNQATADLAGMKEGKSKAKSTIRSAERTIASADETIANTKNEAMPQRMTEAEIGAAKKRVAELNDEIEKDTKNFDELAQKIYEVNKRETDAAIEMAQSENVSMEKVKQAIDLLKEKIRTEATDEQTMQARGDAINRLTERYTQMSAEVAKLSKPIADRLSGDFGKMSETEIRQGIDAAKELVKTYEMGSDEAKELTNNIARADQYLRDNSVDAARQAQQQAAQLELMKSRMDNLGTLSNAAFDETKKFWQAMYDGAEKNDPELKNIEERLKNITAEEAKRSRAVLEQSAGRLGRTNLGTLSANELRQSIEDAKKLQGTYAETSKEAQALAQMIVKAEEYAKTHGVEAVRQAQKEKEAIRQREEQEQQLAVQMRQRLMERKTLSADALSETKKYWLAQKNGAEEGTLAFRRAEAALKMLDNVESERNAARQQALADRLKLEPEQDPADVFKNYSTAELKESIEAAKQVALSFKSGSDEAAAMNKAIVAAEEHISKFGVEAERAAKKQADARKEMEGTLTKAQNGEYATASMDTLDDAIKKLKAYQALIEDPNGLGKDTFDATKTQIEGLTTQLNALKGVTEKTKGAFASADEVLARFGEHMAHMNADTATQQTEKLASTIDDKLNAATSEYDDNIKGCLKSIDYWEKELKESEDKVASLEAEYNNLVKLLNSGNPFKRLQGEIKGGWKRANNIQSWLEGDGSEDNFGWRPSVQDAKNEIKDWKKSLAFWKEQKAEALGLNEAEEQVAQTEEKLQQTRRMTREELQQGIKILEEEAIAQDRTTVDGQKKWEELRKTIDQMNQELKESTGEWMKLADAEKLAEQAGENYYLDNSKKGFYASPEEIQKATAALNRQRETLIKTIQTKKANGDATEEEEKKLADLTKKLKDLKFEQDNLNMSQEKMRMLMKQPTEAVSLDELRAAIKRADGELKRMEGSLGANSKQYKEFAAEVKAAKNTLKEMEGQAKATSSAWDKAWSRLKTYVGMYMGFNMLWNKMTGTMDDMMTLSDKMGEVCKTTGFTADEVGRLSDNLAKLDTRTNLTGLMEFSSLAGSVGLKTQEAVQGFTEAANMLAVSLPEMGNEVSRTLMKISDATGDLEKNGGDIRETLERVGSTIIALRANSAAAASPIVDFVSRVGAVGAQAGISIDQIAALGATVDALGGRVEMSATALSRMIPAIKNNSFAVAQAIGMTEKELKGKTGMEQMVAIFRALHNSVKGFDTSTEEGMNAMADSVEKALGRSTSMQDVMKQLNQQGARAGIVFGLLSQNVDTLEEQLRTAGEAYENNTALLDEYNKMNDTTAAKWEKLKNQIEEMFVSDNMQHWLGLLIKGLREVVDLISMDGPIGDFFRFSLVYFALWKAKWAEAIGTALMSLGQFLTATEASTAASTADAAAKTTEAAATEGVAVANEKAAVATGKFGKALKANLIGLAVTVVAFLAMKLLDMSRNAKKAATELDTLAKAEKRAADESVNERAKLEQLYKVTQDQNRSMEERRKALHDMVGDAKYKEYQEDLLTESNLASTAAKAYGELATQIVKAAKARVYQEEIEKLAQENLKLEDANEEAEKYVKDKKSSYERVSQNVATTPVAAGMFGTTAAAAQTHNDGQRQFLREYEQKQQDIIDNQEKIKKNNETIGKFEQKLKDTGVKLGDEEGDGNGGGGGGGGTNPYGDYDKVKSAYSEWNGNDLVARRKEMLERVKALANGADVQAVLSEDAKFISEAVRKNIKTTEQAIEWYNTERLKIQEALHAKHLTNTGDWLDPKKGAKRASRLVQDEMKYYLDELDAYYTERKAKIQEAQNDQEISEAEARNRTLANEAEWQQRRAELQLLYSKKRGEVTQQEADAIYNIISERTGETSEYIKADIAQTIQFILAVGQKSKAAMDRINGDIELSAEKSFLRQRNAIGQHMKAIQDIIDKERPFNGITKNLQDNLTTMGILAGHMQKEMDELMAKNEDMTDFNNRQAAEKFRELTFLLGESEHAYSTTIEEVMKRASDEGLTAWVEYMRQNPKAQEGMMAQLRSTYDAVQDAIKKEASQMKKQAEIMWNNILLPGGDGKTTIKDAFEQTISTLGIEQGRVSRANSMIGAGQASERVADNLAIKQMQLQLTMQRHYYNLMQKQGQQRVDMLDAQAKKLKQQAEQMKAIGKEAESQKLMDEYKAKMLDKQHAEMSLNLATTKEQTELAKQQEEIIARTEESQARLYKELREWGDLLASSMREVFEASNAGNAEYYNELAKLNLTGKGGPGAGTYIVIDNEGTEDAKAHYEYLDERAALERQREIEQQNAQADAWKKVMDDLNQKMNDLITDQLNAMLQNASIDANTSELVSNTQAMTSLTGAVNTLAGTMSAKAATEDAYKPGGNGKTINGGNMGVDENGVPIALQEPEQKEEAPGYGASWMQPQAEQAEGQPGWYVPLAMPEEEQNPFAKYAEWSNAATDTILNNQQKVKQGEQQTDKSLVSSSQATFAKMALAANLYGVAYQAVSNENLSTTQKFEMIALQSVGNFAISSLTAFMAEAVAKGAVNEATVLGKLWSQLGWAAAPVFAIFTGLLGAAMGAATSAVSKSKSQISQVTGSSVSAGRLATGMLTYAEGNVNEMTDPSTLTPGRHYNVDGADGRTYRAKYMGRDARTHITTGPEFHLVGEKGREAIIDAHTTRNIQMNDPEIWRTIQTLYNGGSMSRIRSRRGRGVKAFAEGNLDDFEEIGSEMGTGEGADTGMIMGQMAAFQQSLDRNSAIMERLADEGIEAFVSPYGKRGIVNGYDTYKKEAQRHGERY